MKLSKPISVILDTDTGPDCDDAGALAILHNLAGKGEARILSVMHCTSNPYGAGCIDAINRFYGCRDIPVGTLKKEGFLIGPEYEKYNKYITENYENAYKSKSAQDAVELYRKTLYNYPDGSVDIIAIGPLINLAHLLESKPDEACEYSGMELVSKKIRRLVSMAGRFEVDENGVLPAEWNIFIDIQSAQKVFHNWPTPIVFCGFEIGESVITGKKLMEIDSDTNPVKKAYELYTSVEGRNSWDLTAVLYAIRGDCGFWELSESGNIQVDNSGVTHFIRSKEGAHRYMKKVASAEAIATYLEELLIHQETKINADVTRNQSEN